MGSARAALGKLTGGPDQRSETRPPHMGAQHGSSALQTGGGMACLENGAD